MDNYSVHKSTKLSNEILPYQSIFNNSKKYDIELLKKKEFDIFYSGKLKYPLLVKESISINTGKTDPNETPIDRRYIIDPFREDPTLPPNKSFTLQDYKNYMAFGGSMGHNAPAGQHKTSMDVYSETFLLSNITPQEIVLNSGLWALFENWCKFLGKHNKLMDITVFTGSIPNKSNYNLYDTKMNIPIKMFKIVCFNHIDFPNTLFMDIFVCRNSPYYINYNKSKQDLSSYIISHDQIPNFLKETHLDLNRLLDFYNLNKDYKLPVSNIVHTSIFMNSTLSLLMKKSYWFGKMVYVNSLNELENNWKTIQKYEKQFEVLDYHREYYELTKKRYKDKIEGLLSGVPPKSLQSITHQHKKSYRKKTRYRK